MSLAVELVKHCSAPIDDATLDRARRHLVDWAGCVIGARNEPLAEHLRSTLEAGTTPTFGAGLRSTESAVTYAGALGNCLEMDDLARSALVHPGPIIVPTALYFGLTNGVSYREVLHAIVRGYEAAQRLGASLDAFHYQRWHPTTTVGIPAAALTAATIIRLNEKQTLAALANALSVSGGLWHMRHDNTTTKQWHSVHAIRTGIQSALHAHLGFSGSEHIIEGQQGWHFGLTETPNPAAITDAGPWAIHSVSFKPWPACRHCHPAIDAALIARAQMTNRDYAAIKIKTYSDALTFCDNDTPVTATQARFSLQHCVAAALLDGTMTLADFGSTRRNNLAIEQLRQVTRVELSEQFDDAYPGHFGAHVEVTDGNGQRFGGTVNDAMGDPEWPLDEDALLAKFQELVKWGGLPTDSARNFATHVLNGSPDQPIKSLLDTAP